MKKSPAKVVYAVVDVWRGCATEIRIFRKRQNATTCLRRLRRGRNLDEDDVQLFAVPLSWK
jgi:hypothetical protein